MKKGMPWNACNNDSSSESDESSSSLDTDTKFGDGSSNKRPKTRSKAAQLSKEKASEAKSGKRKTGAIGFEALSQYGYQGGLSVLKVPMPKEDDNQDWSWSTGREKGAASKDANEESYEERQKTRAAIAAGEELRNAQSRREKTLSFSQKEKRKRDLGQASRGKNYVEEEKRLLRDSGVYSGFDS